MQLKFYKYHGAGNDFIMIDNREDDAKIWNALTPEIIANLCQRNLGIGADGIIQAIKAKNSDVPYTMGYFNADGTPAEMCGNGLRCLMRFLADLGEDVQEADEVKIMTGAGVVVSRFTEENLIQVMMPRPSLKAKDAKINLEGDSILVNINVPGIPEALEGSGVSVGNPHFVIYNNEMWEGYQIHEIGSRIAAYKDMFPEGSNVGFARKESPDTLALVVYERGVGPTLACGSGAIAAVAAGVANFKFSPDQAVNVRMPGGMLKVTIGEDNRYALLEGDAVKVFEGFVEI